jgi:hypothetical protein
MRIVASLLAIAGLAFHAAAQTPPPAKAPDVSEVVVPGGPAPKVVKTFPAEGATVSAGELALEVTFDHPMSAARWGYGEGAGGAFPTCLAHPRLLADTKSFVLLCQVKANTAYAIDLGATPGFTGDAGRKATPLVLKFSTNEQVVDNLHDALDEAGLTDADEPIMTGEDDGKTPPRSPATPGG